MALPAIESLARAFPFAHIHAFTGRHSAPVFRASEFINQVYLMPDQLTPSRVPGLAWNLRTAGHDWIVVLDRSRLVVAAARSANPARLVTIPRGKDQLLHEIDVYLSAVETAGVRPASDVPKLTLPDEARDEARREVLADTAGRYAVIHPGGAENPGVSMVDKRWPQDRYAQVVTALEQRGIRTVLTGGPSDIELCERIFASGDSTTSVTGQLDLMGTTAVIEGADLYLGADTGVSHLAAAVGTPAIVIFGPTNPERYAPRGENVVVLAPEKSRSLPDADLRKIRANDDRPGTSEITVEAVLAEVDRLLEPGGSNE